MVLMKGKVKDKEHLKLGCLVQVGPGRDNRSIFSNTRISNLIVKSNRRYQIISRSRADC